MRFEYCFGTENGTQSLRAGELSSLALFAVAVDGQNDFGEETSDPNGDKLPWFTYEINNQVSNVLTEVV